jgi:hypothetical protein
VIGGVASNRAANKAADASQRAIDANAWQGQIALDQYDEYKNSYRPLEHQLVKQAQDYDTPQAYEQAAGKAQATVQDQIGLARERLARTPGLDPSSAAAHAANTNLELRGAALGAVEQNMARERVKDKAFARTLDVAGLGKGLIAGASSGLANASAGAEAIARSSNQQAAQTASGIGALVGGVANGLSKVNWGSFGSGTGGGAATNNTGSPVWTQVLAGSSGYPDGAGGGV